MNPRLSREKLVRLLPPLGVLAVAITASVFVPALRPVLDIALPFFGLIGLGYACGVLFDTPPEGLAWLNTFIIWLALPSLLFLLVASTPVDQLADWRFILCTGAATASCFALGFLNGKLFARASAPEATIQAFVASYSNIGYMGPGLTLTLLGAAAAAPTALIFVADTLFLFSALPIAMAIGQGGGRGLGRTAALALWRIVSHPFNIATVAGLVAAITGFHASPPVNRVLTLLSGAAAPCALFALGVTVGLRPIRRIGRELPVALAIKLLFHPFFALLYLSLVGGFDRVWVFTAVLMASLPPALNVFVMASQYGVYVERASSAILLGTLASVLTVTAVMWLVSTGRLPVSLLAMS